MNTLISMLLTFLNNITTDNTTREIVRQILISYDDFENLKAAELAKRSFCNSSTINRFCRSIGYSSFNDMKESMNVSHNTRMRQIEHHIEITDEEEILKRIDFLASEKMDMDAFRQECTAFNALLKEAPYATVIGAVYPEALMLHYQEDMIEMGKCVYSAPVKRQLEDPNEDPEALLILVSFTGRLISYCANDFSKIKDKYSRIAIITADENYRSDSDRHIALHLPFHGDDESCNTAFIEIMRYLKYRYYMDYYTTR